MFLRSTKRWKGGKDHYYWSLVENRRCKGGRVVQHTVLYLGEPEPKAEIDCPQGSPKGGA